MAVVSSWGSCWGLDGVGSFGDETGLGFEGKLQKKRGERERSLKVSLKVIFF